jgi:hypothetical protein
MSAILLKKKSTIDSFFAQPVHLSSPPPNLIVMSVSSPQSMLYTHCKESVCAFLGLGELGHMLRVSRSWGAAVGSMRSIHAKVHMIVSSDIPPSLCTSGLTHHIGRLDLRNLAALNGDQLESIARHLPNLYDFRFYIVGSCPTPRFHPKLSRLSVMFANWLGLDIEATTENVVIVEASRLHRLRQFEVELLQCDRHISFYPLQKAPMLDTLTIRLPGGRSVDDLEYVRAFLLCPHLTDLDVALSREASKLLLDDAHAKRRFKRLSSMFVDNVVDKQLQSMSQLAALHANNVRSVVFLTHLDALTDLSISFEFIHDLVSADTFVAAASCCTRIETLKLTRVPLKSRHLHTLLGSMSRLRKLTLQFMHYMESLQFLAVCTHLHSTLECMTLDRCECARLYTSEFKNVLYLAALVRLVIIDTGVGALDPFGRATFTPPCTLKRLKLFQYHRS